MIKNLWQKVKLYCGNHGDNHGIVMELHEAGRGGAGVFYSCPKYYPDARQEGERACVNHISIDEFDKMLSHLSSLIEEGEANGEQASLLNVKWRSKRGVDYKVIAYTEQHIGVLVLNNKALA